MSRPIVRLAELRDTVLSVDEVLAAVADPAAGGTALFVGTVRDRDAGRNVTNLAYTAHPGAERVLAQVCREVGEAPGVVAVAAVHRCGTLHIGELAVVVAVACAHRGAAFEACRALIDRVKAEVPIWKLQRFDDGSEQWVGADCGAG